MILQITLPRVNVSLQIGDLVYYAVQVGSSSGSNHPGAGGADTKPKVLGVCVLIGQTFIHVDNMLGGGVGAEPDAGCVIMFQKDKRAGLSGIIGYYALTEYRNYATIPVEMFATAVDYVESSK